MEKDRYGDSSEGIGLTGRIYLLRQQLMNEKDKVRAKEIFCKIKTSCLEELGIDIVAELSEKTKNDFKKYYGNDFFDNNMSNEKTKDKNP